MKTAFKAFSLLFAICSLLILVGCTGDGENATISIKISAEPGKAAISVDQLKHSITLTGPTGTKTLTIAGAGTAKAAVVPGLWTIGVEAYFGEELYAVGSSIAEVKAGRNTDVSVQMTVVWTDTAGIPNSPATPIIKHDAEIGTWAELDTYISGLASGDDKIILITNNISDADSTISINNGITVSLFATTIRTTISRDGVVHTGALFHLNTGTTLNLGMPGTPANLILDGALGMGGSPATNALIVFASGGTLNMYDGAVLQNNENGIDNGGAVKGSGINDTFNMEGGSIQGNKALNGGGVYFSTGYLFMSGNAIITGNFATDTGPSVTSYGGGVCFDSTSGVMEMSGDSQIINNGINGDGLPAGLRAESTQGGGVYFRGSSFTMKENALVGSNKTEGDYYGYGGGAYFENVALVTMEGNASIVGNTAETSLDDIQGGGVHFTGTNFNLKGSSKINGNTALSQLSFADGGGIYVKTGNLIMSENSEIMGNTAQSFYISNGGGVFLYGGTSLDKTGATKIDGYGAGPDDTRNTVKNTGGIPETSTTSGPGHAVYADGIYRGLNGDALADYDLTTSNTTIGPMPSGGGWDF